MAEAHPVGPVRHRAPLLPPGVLAQRVGRLSQGAAGVGILLIALGIADAVRAPHELYTDPLSGYDPPFVVVAGILLLVLAPRLVERTPASWLFTLFAPLLAASAAILSPNVYSIVGAAAAIGFVGLLARYRGGFYRPGTEQNRTRELAVIVTGLLTLLFGTVGARALSGQFRPALGGWPEALYFTVTTISTNGSQIEPATNLARLFVVGLILLGVGTFLSAVVVIFLPFVERRLTGLTARLERAQMQELEQHVIVCGASPEANAAARAIRDSGARPLILSSDSQAVELLRSEGFRTHLGDPSVEDDLRDAGIDRAMALVAAQPSDAENLLTVITARGLQPNLRIVAIATSETSIPKLRRAGANEAISVVRVAAELLASAALGTPGPSSPRTGRPATAG
jgi:voltage-gated potassium channel